MYIYIYHLCLVFVRRMKIAIHFWQSNAWSFDTNLPASCRGRQVYNPGEAYHIGCWSKLVRRCLKSFNNAQGKRENLMDIQKCIYVFFSLLFSLRNIKDVSSRKCKLESSLDKCLRACQRMIKLINKPTIYACTPPEN